MAEMSYTMAMVAIIGALFVGFVTDSIVSKTDHYNGDKQQLNTSKTITETFDGDFEKDLHIKMKIGRNQDSDLLGSSFLNEMLNFLK